MATQIARLSSFINNAGPVAWLVAGTCLQAFLSLVLPTRVSFLPSLALSAAHWLWRSGRTASPMSTPGLPGRMKAQLPDEDGSMSTNAPGAEVVLFVVGISSSQ